VEILLWGVALISLGYFSLTVLKVITLPYKKLTRSLSITLIVTLPIFVLSMNLINTNLSNQITSLYLYLHIGVCLYFIYKHYSYKKA